MKKRRSLRTRLSTLKDPSNESWGFDLSPSESLQLVWPLTVDAWSFINPQDAERRLQRHIVRVIRP
ncbi:MAG: hypothetical protein ACT4O3_06210 [Elusimicrobiota bacterium]